MATSYAIEALRIFDHLHFRTVMQDVLGDGKNKKAKNGKKGGGKKAPAKKPTLTLQKPTAISGAKAAWFEKYYEEGSVAENDRKLFSH